MAFSGGKWFAHSGMISGKNFALLRHKMVAECLLEPVEGVSQSTETPALNPHRLRWVAPLLRRAPGTQANKWYLLLDLPCGINKYFSGNNFTTLTEPTSSTGNTPMRL